MEASPGSAAYPPPQRAQGCGCCAAGCGTFLFIGIALVTVVLIGSWYLYSRAVDAVTSETPLTVQLEEPNETQFTAASEKLRQLEAAAAAKEAVTVEFSAADLNALIARHPRFNEIRGTLRVAIADSIATLDLSVPLRKIRLPRVKQRWFNGTVSFGVSYNEDSFTFSPRTIIANDYSLAEDFFDDFAPTFNNFFNREWDSTDHSREAHGDFWPQVRSLEIVGDKVVITTKGPARGDDI